MNVGYTAGVFDLFHVGHLNLLRNSRAMCDRLIVGVTVDELVAYKHKRAVIPFHERIEIVRSCRYVDVALPQVDLNKFTAWEKLHFKYLFVGDDWYQHPRWRRLEADFAAVNAQVVYFPYTQGTSSSLINHVLQELRGEGDVPHGDRTASDAA